MTNFKHTAHLNWHQLGLLGRPINVGDRVLTKSYGSSCMDTLASVVAVNCKSVSIDVNITKWEKNENGRWYRAPAGTKRMKRIGYCNVLVVNELEPISTTVANEFINSHPELAI